MRKEHLVFLIVAAMLTSGFFVSKVQAGVKADVCFQRPGVVDGVGPTSDYAEGSVVKIRDVKITRINTGETKTLPEPWKVDQCALFENIQTGFGPILFRFEWQPGLVAAQVIDVWLHFPAAPAHNMTLYRDIPAHNVRMYNDTGKKVSVRGWSSRVVGAGLKSSAPNKWGNVGHVYDSLFQPWNSPRDIPMLNGCYTVIAAWPWNGCPGGQCNFDVVDEQVCVGGGPDVDLDNDDGDDDPATGIDPALEVYLEDN